MQKHFSILFIIACVIGLRLPAVAQSCVYATCNAASANQSDVLAALPSSSNTNATVVVNIPSGTGAWTSQLTYTVPASVTNLTIQGNTTVSCTGTPGTSCIPVRLPTTQSFRTTTRAQTSRCGKSMPAEQVRFCESPASPWKAAQG